MKILNIISDTNIGGAGLSLLNYVKYHSPENDVCVAVPSGSMLIPRLEALGIRCIETHGLADRSLDLSAVSELKHIIREESPDIVHTHGAMAGRIAGKLCGRTVIFTRHSAFPLPPRLTHGVGKIVYGGISNLLSDRAIAVSPICGNDLIKGGMKPEKIDIVFNGTEPLPIPDSESRARAREKFGVSNDVFVMGIPARIEEYKGHMFILEAAKKLKEQGRKFAILIAGTGTFETDVKNCAETLGVNDCVHFLGFCSDMQSFYASLDLQLNASTIEATSMSLIEGMSIGLPAVVSDAGGNPWVIENGINGLVFPSRDSTSLAAYIGNIMDSPSLYETLKNGALRIFSEKFTASAFAQGVEQTYRKALEEKRHGR